MTTLPPVVESAPPSGVHSPAQTAATPAAVSPYLWMLSGSLAFSGMATLAHALAGRCDWEIVAAVRAGLALLFATTLAWRAGAQLVFFRPRILWLRSISGTVSLLCTFYALLHLPIADVLTITNMFPVWVALLSWPLDGERPTKDAWSAIFVGILGVVLIAQPHFANEDPLPAIIALVASFSTSIAMLGLHRLRDVHPLAIVSHFSGVSFFACLSLLVLDPADSWGASHFDTITLSMLGGVGLCATIGQFFLTKAFAAGPPARVSVVDLTQVAFAMVLDVIVFGREFNLLTLVGILLVTAPTAWLLVTQRHTPDPAQETPA